MLRWLSLHDRGDGLRKWRRRLAVKCCRPVVSLRSIPATAQHPATALKSERLFPFQRIDRLPIRTRRDENELLGPLHEEPRWGVHILDAREQLHGTREFAFAPACQRLGIGLRVR